MWRQVINISAVFERRFFTEGSWVLTAVFTLTADHHFLYTTVVFRESSQEGADEHSPLLGVSRRSSECRTRGK